MRFHMPAAPWVSPALCIGLILGGALTTEAVSADVLITRDGARVETKGAWKVEGRQVIFTLPNGTLSAMRASEVDLDASRSATHQASAPAEPPPPPPPPPPPVLVLTNKDLPEVIEGAGGSGAPGSPTAPGDREPVQVTSWRQLEVDEGIEIRGTLQNTAKSTMAASISVSLEVKDEDDEVIGTAVAFLRSETLMPGSSTSFKATLTDVPDFAGEPVFTVQSSALTLGGQRFGPGEQADAGDDGGDSDDVDDGDDSAVDDASEGESGADDALGEDGGGLGGDEGSEQVPENQSPGYGYEDETDEEQTVNSDG